MTTHAVAPMYSDIKNKHTDTYRDLFITSSSRGYSPRIRPATF